MRKIIITCPICLKNKRVELPLNIFEIDEGSLLKYPIDKNIVCSHRFIILLDYNFSIRDYEILKNKKIFEEYLSKINIPISNLDYL